jgi:RNA polymerase sigma-70 factor, ECF subfamily
MVHIKPNSVGPLDASGGVFPVEQQFQRVIAEFGPSLIRLSLGYELDPDRRRDLLQDIYIAVWRSLAIFNSRCSLRTWVYRVAHNTAVKHVIRARRHALVSLKSLEEIDEIQDPRNAEDDLHRTIALQQLSLVIARLKPLDRQVILLYIEDIGADEIAEITGLSPGGVGVRVHRVKRLSTKIFSAGVQDVRRR